MTHLQSIESELKSIFTSKTYLDTKLKEIVVRGYHLCKPEEKKVLFIGMNPSYPKVTETEFHVYTIKDATEDYLPYFQKFKSLADDMGLADDWAYLDTFVFRETDQKQLDKLLALPDGLDFLVKQLIVTQGIIEELKPELIIICNSGARRFYGIDKTEKNGMYENVWMGYNFRFSEGYGVDVITGLHEQSILGPDASTNLVGVPVLFTSNLRYMDSSNMRRLVWQTRRILRGYGSL